MSAHRLARLRGWPRTSCGPARCCLQICPSPAPASLPLVWRWGARVGGGRGGGGEASRQSQSRLGGAPGFRAVHLPRQLNQRSGGRARKQAAVGCYPPARCSLGTWGGKQAARRWQGGRRALFTSQLARGEEGAAAWTARSGQGRRGGGSAVKVAMVAARRPAW